MAKKFGHFPKNALLCPAVDAETGLLSPRKDAGSGLRPTKNVKRITLKKQLPIEKTLLRINY